MRNNHMVGTRTEDNKSIQHFNSNTDTRALLLLVLHGDGDGLDVSTHCNLFLLLIIDKNVRFIILMLELFIMLLMLCCFLWSTIRYFFNSVANWTLAIVFVNPNIFSIVDCVQAPSYAPNYTKNTVHCVFPNNLKHHPGWHSCTQRHQQTSATWYIPDDPEPERQHHHQFPASNFLNLICFDQ